MSATPDAPYFFFLSYAREDRKDDPNSSIVRFFEDLSAAVRMRTNWPVDRVGFLETEAIGSGGLWPKQLSHHVANCRAFVPVLSPTYFDRQFCGKEWGVFARRLESYAKTTGGDAALIQPVQLVGRHHLGGAPSPVRDVQRTDESFPVEYEAQGLVSLVSLNENADAYARFVAAFADRLVSVVSHHVLPPSPQPPDILTAPNAFIAGAAAPEPELSGPKFAEFCFVAARRAELASTGLRNDLAFYGDEGGQDWRPFRPKVPDEVVIIAQEVATAEKLRFGTLPLDDRLMERIEDAIERNVIIVVVVDSWTVRLKFYRELMSKLDGRDTDNCIVVVPWNDSDPETAAQGDLLVKAIETVFANKARRRDPHNFLDRARSHQQLKAELAKSLVAVQRRILDNHAVLRRAESEHIFVDPQFAAPPAL
jgi:FxsC-like protein